MKSFPQLSTIGGRVSVLLMELTVFLGMLGLRCRGHGGQPLQHGMIPYFHEDASRVCGKPWIYNLEMQPSVPRAMIPIYSARVPFDKDFAFPWGFGTISTNLTGADEVCGFSQCFRKSGFLLFG